MSPSPLLQLSSLDSPPRDVYTSRLLVKSAREGAAAVFRVGLPVGPGGVPRTMGLTLRQRQAVTKTIATRYRRADKNWGVVRTGGRQHRYDTRAELLILNKIWTLQSQAPRPRWATRL